jgi:hypothetical protein
MQCHRGTIDENEDFRHKYDWNGHLSRIARQEKALWIKLRQLSQPFENQWDASVIQDKSWNRIEKTRFTQKGSCCFGEILGPYFE